MSVVASEALKEESTMYVPQAESFYYKKFRHLCENQ